MALRVVDLIHKKRSGEAFSEEEIRFLVEGYTKGVIPDYQMSALAMAIYFRGMDRGETVILTDVMAHSGDMVDLSCFGDSSVDKHSTGGVGDKTTLVVAPLLAVLGGKVAKISGRGLGHTGGTIDKLESIPGFRTELSPEGFLRQVEEIGLAVVGQTGNLTPADKKLYALRDVTDTVDSLPLIAASIMSKKLAGGAKNIVLDVKVGSGAFLKTEAQGRELARLMVDIGNRCGRRVSALLTNMDVPLGTHIGNALEVIEAAETLQGRGNADFAELCLALSAQLVSKLRGIPVGEAEAAAREALSSGAAWERFKAWIGAQGGDPRAVEDYSLLPAASETYEVCSPVCGYLSHMDTAMVGLASSALGAGRATKRGIIDHAAGIVLKKKTGDLIEKGEPLAVLYTNRRDTLAEAEKLLLNALEWSDMPPEKTALILGTVE